MSDLADRDIEELLASLVEDIYPPDRWDDVAAHRTGSPWGRRLLIAAVVFLIGGLTVLGLRSSEDGQSIDAVSDGSGLDGASVVAPSDPEAVHSVPIIFAPMGPEPKFDTRWLGEEIVIDRDFDLDELGPLGDEVWERLESEGATVYGLKIQVLGRMEGDLSYRYQYSTELGSSLYRSCWHRGPGTEVKDLCGVGDLLPYSAPLVNLGLDPNPGWIEIGVVGPPAVISLTQDSRSLWQRPIGGLVVFPVDPEGNETVITAWYAAGNWMDSGLSGPPVARGVTEDPIGVELTTVGGIRISVEVADNLELMVEAARLDGVELRGEGYRSLATYRYRRDNGECLGVEGAGPIECESVGGFPQMAIHAQGLAVDFAIDEDGTNRLITVEDSEYWWLRENAERFGFFNSTCCSDTNHWSVTGY